MTVFLQIALLQISFNLAQEECTQNIRDSISHCAYCSLPAVNMPDTEKEKRRIFFHSGPPGFCKWVEDWYESTGLCKRWVKCGSVETRGSISTNFSRTKISHDILL